MDESRHMPYLSVSAADLQRSHGLTEGDLPDGAVLWGAWSTQSSHDLIHTLFPNVRDIAERTVLIEQDGRRVWLAFVFGAAMAATHAHMAAVLGARSVVQVGTFGGLAPHAEVGDVLVPSRVVGRDGVSRQLATVPIEPDVRLRALLCQHLSANGVGALDGTLVTTTTIALERERDIRRWQRSGFAGVEMEAASTMAVAQHFGLPTAGAFVLFDNVGLGHTVFTRSEEDRQRTQTARLAVLRAAVATVAGA